MRLVSLKDVPNYSDKELLPQVRGRITSIGKRATGNGNYGPWSLQDIEIDGDGMRFTVVVDGHDELPHSLKGRLCDFTCVEGDKGLSGVYAHDDKKKNNLRKIKVTKTGSIDIIEEGGAPHQERQPDRPREEPRQDQRTDSRPPPDDRTPSQTSHQPPAQRGSDQDIAEVKRQITQCANLMLLCQICVEKVVVPGFKNETGKDMDEVRKSALATSLYISAERKGANTLLPTHPITNARQQPPQEDQAKW